MQTPNKFHDSKTTKESSEYWETMYQEFLDFRRKQPQGMPPAKIAGATNPLFTWVQQQHQFKLLLSVTRLKKLNAARFVWATNEIDPE
ncbi:MAG: hypothetical protein WCQ95_02060 [Bacteroidota bacterium]